MCIDSKGYIITALHVVSCRFPFRHDELLDDSIKIIARSSNGLEFELEKEPTYIKPINFDFFKELFYIDLAILQPKNKLELPFVPYLNKKIEVGEKVIIGGYPKDSKSPLFFIEKLKKEYINNKEKWKWETNLLFKLAMVGFSTPISFNNKEIEGDVFYLDNELHAGGSSGAVINFEGKLVGIITDRAVINVDVLNEDGKITKTETPSGLSCAISPRLLVNFIKNKQ